MQKTLAFALLLGAVVVPACLHADELFDDRAHSVRFSLAGLWEKLWEPRGVHAEAVLAAIAPAAGDEGHGEPAEGEGGEHAAKKSHTGKDLTGKPSIPTVMIGGQAVVTSKDQRAKDVSASTPPGLKGPATTAMLEQRARIKTYAHSPVSGPSNARINVVLFEDLSCNQCMPFVAKIDTALQAYASDTRVTFVNAPTLKFQDTNQPAFFGKIAAKMGAFWTYRAKLIANPPADDAALFNELIDSGVKLADARSMMLADARRFYRELDGDALLAESFRVNKPPVVYVNGIRLGEGGLPLESLDNVLSYVHKRIELKLGEPPQ